MPGKHLCNNCSQFFTLKALVKHMNECVVNVAEEQQTVVPDKRRKVEEAIEHSMEGLLDNSSSFDLEGCEVEEVTAEKNGTCTSIKNIRRQYVLPNDDNCIEFMDKKNKEFHEIMQEYNISDKAAAALVQWNNKHCSCGPSILSRHKAHSIESRATIIKPK
ncbi:hypothetical protein EDC96DRAFT_613321, partial [Choanephora cucurbitarum]